MKKILKIKGLKSLLLLFINISITATLVFVGLEQINNNIEEIRKIKVITGVIRISKEIEEYDEHAKELGMQESGQNSSTSSDGQNSNTSLNSSGGTQVTLPPTNSTTVTAPSNPSINYASLTGHNIVINEGEAFDPLTSLNIKAIDQNGADITKKVQIMNNSVNVNQPGYYSVLVKVKLKDNTELIQTFSVEVIGKPLVVNVSNVTLTKSQLEKEEAFKLNFRASSSKSGVIPVKAIINGSTYSVVKNANNQYSVNLTAPTESKTESIVLSSIQMSDGTIIAVNEQKTITVLKKKPTVQKLMQTVDSQTGKLELEIKVSDIDVAIKPNTLIIATLYNEANQEVGKQEVVSNLSSIINFDVPINGNYRLEVIAQVNLNHTSDYQNVKLYEEALTINTIDKSTLEGTNATLQEGQSFDPMRDLQLKATNENGEDITSSIMIEHQVDSTIPGTYEVKAIVIKNDGQKIEKLFTVVVEAVPTIVVIEAFNSTESTIVAGQELVLNLELSLSKDYINVESVIINNQEYILNQLDDKKYQVSILTSESESLFDIILSKLMLSNGEELIVNEKLSIHLIKPFVYYNSISVMNNEANHLSLSNEYNGVKSSSSNQIISGPNSNDKHDLAPTMTSFAVIEDQPVGGELSIYESDVQITGQVSDSNNQTPVGQINVTVPSKLGFTVDAAGDVIVATSGKIQNHSDNVDINVSVSRFRDDSPTSGEGITLIEETLDSSNRGQYDRSFMSLTLSANGNTVSLLSTGIDSTKASLGTIAAKGTASLTLDGTAGNADYSANPTNKNKVDIDKTPIKNDFTLTLKIAKVNN